MSNVKNDLTMTLLRNKMSFSWMACLRKVCVVSMVPESGFEFWNRIEIRQAALEPCHQTERSVKYQGDSGFSLSNHRYLGNVDARSDARFRESLSLITEAKLHKIDSQWNYQETCVTRSQQCACWWYRFVRCNDIFRHSDDKARVNNTIYLLANWGGDVINTAGVFTKNVTRRVLWPEFKYNFQSQ